MSLKKRGKTWCVDITAPDGERVRISARTQLKKEAQEFHDQLKADLWRRHQLGEKPKVRRTWQESVVRFIQVKGDKRWLRGMKGCIKDLHPWLGDRYLDEIDNELISTISIERKAMPPRSNSGKGKTVSNATVNRMLAVLRAILKQACEVWGWIDRVPKVALLKEEKTELRWLTKEEVNNLRQELPHHLKQMMLFSVLCGLRMSNVTNLTWKQVNLSTGSIIFSHKEMKNGKPFSIPLCKEAIDVLNEQKGEHSEYVFTYKGEHVKNANTRAFKRALARAGIDSISWHTLRHTFASWHRQNGTPLDVLQELGGWQSEEMVKRYAHLGVDHLAKYTANISTQ